jgi:hypothetical protein
MVPPAVSPAAVVDEVANAVGVTRVQRRQNGMLSAPADVSKRTR